MDQPATCRSKSRTYVLNPLRERKGETENPKDPSNNRLAFDVIPLQGSWGEAQSEDHKRVTGVKIGPVTLFHLPIGYIATGLSVGLMNV